MDVDEEVVRRMAGRFGLHVRRVGLLTVPVNDVARVEAAEGTFALKVYHPGRTPDQVAWEANLVRHLADRGAPVAAPVAGPTGFLEVTQVEGRPRCAVLSPWVDGAKPGPTATTYERLGEAAARIHAAADGHPPSPAREAYGLEVLVDEQLGRMGPLLAEVGERDRVLALGARLEPRLADPGLERGLCHMDLTLDNVIEGPDGLTVIDFDSAGPCWRAIEPSGVLRWSEAAFRSWLAGYRTVRPFGEADEAAVQTLALVGELRNTAWKLGVAATSRTRLLAPADLPAVVDEWLDWERRHLPA